MAYGNALVQLEAHLLEKRILLVDDEAELVEMVRAILRAAGFENVSIARSGEEALRAVEAHAFDLFVLDVMMPGIDGFQLLARLRALPATADVPALFLTAKDEPFDRVNGLTLGADDYVPKPCPPRELAARLNAILRRTANMPSAIAPVVAGPLTINPSRREATANGIVIDLTGTELTLLEVLARKVGTPVPKDEIYQKVLGRAMQRYDRAIDVHVSSIRHKLAAVLGTSVAIESIRGVGYQFVVR